MARLQPTCIHCMSCIGHFHIESAIAINVSNNEIVVNVCCCFQHWPSTVIAEQPLDDTVSKIIM